jgi:hypothetical protein
LSKKLVLCAALVVAAALTAAGPASASFASWVSTLSLAAQRIEASMPAATVTTYADSVDTYKRPDNDYYGKIALAMRALENTSISGPGGTVTFGPYATDGDIESAIVTAFSPAGSVHGALRIFDLGLLSTSPSSPSVTLAALQWANMEWAAAEGHTAAGTPDFLAYASLTALGSFYGALGGEGIINLAAWVRYLPGIDAGFATSLQWVAQLNTRLSSVPGGDALRPAAIGAAIPAFMQHGGNLEAIAWTAELLTLQDASGFFGSAANSTQLKAWNTALAVCALDAMYERDCASQIKSAMDWLVANQVVAAGDDQYTWGGATLLEKLRIAAFVIDCGRAALLDSTPPSVALTAPSSGQAICGDASLSATASDNVEVDRVVFKVDASTVATVIGAGPTYDATVATGAFADGPHTVSATAYDDNNNTASSVASVMVDNTPPSAVSITSPSASAVVGGTVTVKVGATDPTPGSGICNVRLYVDGSGPVASDSTAPYEPAWSSAAFGDGTHALTAVASDCCGHDATSAAVDVVVDNTPPSCSIVAPSPGAYVSGAVSLEADATDANPGVAVAFYLDSTAPASKIGEDTTESPPTPTHGILWDSTGVPDGVKTLVVVATDAAGNTRTATRGFIVDNVGPSVALVAPVENEFISGDSVVWQADASDPAYGVADVKFYRGAVLIATDATPPYTGAFDTTVLSDGTVALSAVATSAGGGFLSATDTNIAVVDNYPPGIAFTAPAAAATVGGTAVAISADASDAGSGISQVTFYVDGTAMGNIIGTDNTAPYSMSWNTVAPPVSNGAHTLYAKAEDRTAKSAIASRSVTVENGVKPGIAWTAPAPNALVNGAAVTLSVDASDNNGIAKVEFYLDAIAPANKIAEDTTAAYSIAWNTKSPTLPVSNGSHVLWARAIDTVADYTDASRAVRVDNQAPGVSFVTPTPAAGATVSGTLTPLAPAQVTIKVDATDYNLAGVASVSIGVFHISPGVPFQTEATQVIVAAPYQITWNTDYLDNGVNRISVTAVDALGNAVTPPLTRTVNVNNASFSDVPFGAFGWQQIERIVRVGITAGCATQPTRQYCPGDPCTRGQMAAFLCRAAGWTLLDPPTPTFADVGRGTTFYRYIETLVAHAVTAGCASTPQRLYCPNESVTRGQMAAFLCRALGLSQYLPPTPTFADVPAGNIFYGYVERVFLVGITTGCLTGPLRYCPDRPVTRDQMAVFLVRAFNIIGPP